MTHKQALKELRKLTTLPIKIETHLVDPPITDPHDVDRNTDCIKIGDEWIAMSTSLEDAVDEASTTLINRQQLCPPTTTTVS